MQKSKRGFGRELALLFLPILLISGSALWLTMRQKEQKARASGPFRTVVTRVDVEDASPFDQWLGFDRQVTVHAETAGQLTPIPHSQETGPTMKITVPLLGNQGGRSTSSVSNNPFQFSYGSESVDYENGLQPIARGYPKNSNDRLEYVLLIRKEQRGRLPLDVCVEQHASVQQPFSPPPKGWTGDRFFPGSTIQSFTASSRSAHVSVDVDETNAVHTEPSHQTPTLVGTKVVPYHFPEGSPGYDFPMTSLEANLADTGVIVQIRVPDIPHNKDQYALRFSGVRLVDKNNREVKLRHPSSDANVVQFRSVRPQGYSPQSNGEFWFKRAMPLKWIPASRGPLFCEGYVSGYNSWPLHFRVQVRPIPSQK